MVVINIIIIITFICQTQIMNENDTPNPIICEALWQFFEKINYYDNQLKG